MIPKWTITILLVACCGCTGLQEPATHIAETPRQVVMPEHLLIEPSQLASGQQVQIVASVSEPAELVAGGSTDVILYTGTVASVDDAQVILTNAEILIEQDNETGAPILNKVPYVSRLFRNSDVAGIFQPLPHGVIIPRSRILGASRGSAQTRERIGIDFDMSVNRTASGP